ncbi:YdcF family protein [Aerosakkonemataceae cyanobacterium BLCC-F50]|uniref:YdcF family protein n=1 Tax=Floridaenema flaviceps BLCC-F50 TaxID=3153642 RepID=A0ABV4XRT1_9CYAN
MEELIVIVLIGIIWMISPGRWRKRFLLPFSMTLVLCLAVTSPWGVDLATQGLVANLPKDTGEPVQAIVVLGRGDELRQRRIEKVEKLWQQQRSSRVFASGMLDAEFMLEQFEKNGIPKTALSGERCSQSTEENALFTSAVLYPQQVQKIILITDSPHIMRSMLVFRASGFDVIPYPIPLPNQWSALRKSQVLLREYLGLLKYSLTDRFRQRTVEELRTPPPDVTQKLVEWNCKLPMENRT